MSRPVASAPALGQERGDVTRAGADLDHWRTVGQLDHPAQQPRFEWQAGELIGELLGIGHGDRGVRGPDLLIPRLGPGVEHRLAVDGHRARSCLGRLDRAEQMDPPAVLLSRLARELAHHRGLTTGHASKARLHLATVGEAVQPLGAGLERSGGLGPAEQQHGEQCPLIRRDPASLRECLDVFHHAAARTLPGERNKFLVLERAQRPMHELFVVVDDGLSAAGLVACGAHRVDAHRVRRRDSDLLLQQAAEHALFDGIEHRHVGHDAEASGRPQRSFPRPIDLKSGRTSCPCGRHPRPG
jgi:hypothetical protein